MTTLIPARVRAGLDRYAALFRRTGAAGFFLPAVVARLGIAMTGLGLLLTVERATGSFAAAGLATGVFAITEAVAGPQVARLVDRFGQTRTVPVAVVVHAGTIVAAVLTAGHVPIAQTIVLVGLAGAAVPQPGALSAARWATVVADPGRLRTAFSLEASVNDVVFLTGPVVVTAVATTTMPWSGSVLAAACLLAGCTVMSAHRRSAPPAGPRPSDAVDRGALRRPAFLALLGVNTGLGCFFGAVPVLVTAAARAGEVPSLAGLVLATSSAASLVAGVVYGSLRRPIAPRTVQLVASVVLVAAVVVGAVRPTLPGLTIVLVLGGTAIAPLVASSAQLVGAEVPEHERTQGFTWLNTASAAGVAGAAAVTGWVVEQGGVGTAAAVLVALTALAPASAAVATRTRP